MGMFTKKAVKEAGSGERKFRVLKESENSWRIVYADEYDQYEAALNEEHERVTRYGHSKA
jgi:hypothetical protein